MAGPDLVLNHLAGGSHVDARGHGGGERPAARHHSAEAQGPAQPEPEEAKIAGNVAPAR